MQLLPENSLVHTGRVDHADWNYRPMLAYLMRRRFALILDLLPPVRVTDMLEVGFGSGVFMPELAARCDHLYGVDVHEHVAEVEHLLARHGVRAQLRCEDASHTKFPDESFDVIVAVSALEFIDDIEAGAAELARLLKPSGRLVAVMPAKSPLLDFGLRLVTGENAQRDYGSRRETVLPALLRHFELVRTRRFLTVYCAYEFKSRTSSGNGRKKTYEYL